jgi:PAS domain S-box-containing protein
LNWLTIAIYLADTDERALIIVDDGGRVRLTNLACERLFGWTRAEIAGQALADLVDDSTRARLVATLGAALGGVPGHCAVRLRAADRALVDADLLLEPVGVEGAGDRGVIGIVDGPRSAPAFGRMVRDQLAALAERHGLSDREREVLIHLALGLSVEDIGRALGIAPRTAKFHQANVLAKLGVGSRLDLLRLLVDPPTR